MVISVISLIFSFLLQGYISTVFNYSLLNPSWFSTIYVLITLIILLPYFENKKKYIKLLIIFGLLIDIVYTNTFVLNTLNFMIIYFICQKINYILPHNILTINLLNIVAIMLYHILTFILLQLIRYDSYSIKSLLVIGTHSILMTVIYGSIMYFIIDGMLQKFGNKIIKWVLWKNSKSIIIFNRVGDI